MRKLLAYAAIYILWGGSFLAIREVVSVVPPFFAAGFRFTLAGLVLIVWARLAGLFDLSARQFLHAALLGIINFMCLYACLFWAETRIPSGVAAIVSAMIPLWIYAGDVLVLRSQRATLLSLAGVVFGFLGVVVLAVYSAPGHGHRSASTIAILVTVAGTLCWSVGTLLSRRLTLPSPQKLNAGCQMFTGGFFLLLLSLAARENHRLPALLSPRVLGSMLYLIVAASIITYTCYVWLIAHDSPTRVSSYAYVNPVIAMILGVALANEHLTGRQMAGAALVIFGVVATLVGRRTRRSRDEDQRPQRKPATVGGR